MKIAPDILEIARGLGDDDSGTQTVAIARALQAERERSCLALEHTARELLPEGTWTTERVRELLLAIASTLRGGAP